MPHAPSDTTWRGGFIEYLLYQVNSCLCGCGLRVKQETVISGFQQVFLSISPRASVPECLLPARLHGPSSRPDLHSQHTGSTSIVPRIINLGGYATFCREHMQPIKKLIWPSARMTGQIRASMKRHFVKTFPH